MAYAFYTHDIQMLVCDLTGTNTSNVYGSGSYTDIPTSMMQYIGFNVTRAPFNDPKLRAALSLGMDRAGGVSAFLLGHGQTAQFPLSPSAAVYPKDLEETYSPDSYRSAMETAGYTSGEKSVSVTMLVNEENSFKVSMARKLASDLSQYDVKIDVKTLPYEDYLAALKAGDFDLYYGECKLKMCIRDRDGTGQVLTGVKWDVVSGSDRVVTLSPVSRDQQVTVPGKGEGDETLLVQAGVTVGQRTFTSELRLTATIHMQGVLGIAHVGDGDAVYRQGILNRDATDWDTPLGPAEGDVPDHEGLYLYSRGKAADFRYFTVTALTVLDSTGTSHDMLSTADEDYRVTVGDVVAAQQDGDFSYRPITIHGRQQETVTLQVTLTDTRTGRSYALDIPYTLTAEDTQITATFVVGRLRLEKAVPFGQPATGFLPTEEELVSALRPVVGWTPSPDLPLFQDTTFEPIYQDTEEPGLLRWRWTR